MTRDYGTYTHRVESSVSRGDSASPRPCQVAEAQNGRDASEGRKQITPRLVNHKYLTKDLWLRTEKKEFCYSTTEPNHQHMVAMMLKEAEGRCYD